MNSDIYFEAADLVPHLEQAFKREYGGDRSAWCRAKAAQLGEDSQSFSKNIRDIIKGDRRRITHYMADKLTTLIGVPIDTVWPEGGQPRSQGSGKKLSMVILGDMVDDLQEQVNQLYEKIGWLEDELSKRPGDNIRTNGSNGEVRFGGSAPGQGAGYSLPQPQPHRS